MNIYTPNDSDAMANAIAQIYPNPTLALLIEQTIFATADTQIEGYGGGIWHFHSNGTTGFWVPDMPSVPVSCDNYYQNPAMDPVTFGVGITLLSLNHLVWRLHERDPKLALGFQNVYDDLYDWAYGDDSPLDIPQLYSYLD